MSQELPRRGQRSSERFTCTSSFSLHRDPEAWREYSLHFVDDCLFTFFSFFKFYFPIAVGEGSFSVVLGLFSVTASVVSGARGFAAVFMGCCAGFQGERNGGNDTPRAGPVRVPARPPTWLTDVQGRAGRHGRCGPPAFAFLLRHPFLHAWLAHAGERRDEKTRWHFLVVPSSYSAFRHSEQVLTLPALSMSLSLGRDVTSSLMLVRASQRVHQHPTLRTSQTRHENGGRNVEPHLVGVSSAHVRALLSHQAHLQNTGSKVKLLDIKRMAVERYTKREALRVWAQCSAQPLPPPCTHPVSS